MTLEYLLPKGRSNGLFVDTDLARSIHKGSITTLLDVVRHDLKGGQYLLCDHDFAYGIIEFSKNSTRVPRPKAMTIADSSGTSISKFQGDWATRRKFYKTDFSFDKFEVPRRIAPAVAGYFETGPATIIHDTVHGIIDVSDPAHTSQLNTIVYPVTTYIIPI